LITFLRQTDYAARVVLHLAALPEGARVTASEIAGKRLIPPAFVRRIVGRLAAAGILQAVRGLGGGISLARPSSEISLLDVVEAMEGPILLNSCLNEAVECPLAEACPVQSAWRGASQSLASHLDSIRFDALAAKLAPSFSVSQGKGKTSKKAAPRSGRRRGETVQERRS
jgi:Rrf2 family protein